jgi:hypothetical protein
MNLIRNWMESHRTPPKFGTEKTIRADEALPGQTVTRVAAHYSYKPFWRRQPRSHIQEQTIRRHGGPWPTVVEADYYRFGEGDGPTVYLKLTSDPSCSFCLHPDDQVTILEPAGSKADT